MADEKYVTVGHLFVPLPRIFENVSYHAQHVGTFTNNGHTVYMMALNASGKEDLPAALDRDIEVLDKAIEARKEDSSPTDWLEGQKKVIGNMRAQITDHQYIHEPPSKLLEAAEKTASDLTGGRVSLQDKTIYTSGIAL